MVHHKVNSSNQSQKVNLASRRGQLIAPPGWPGSHTVRAVVLWMLQWVASRFQLAVVTKEQARSTTPAEVTYPSGWRAREVCAQRAGVAYQPIASSGAAPLIEAFPDASLSQNFRLSEFRVGEPGFQYLRISPELIHILELIRERAGAPVRITSGYRPKHYNRRVGGASSSAHTDGLAVDIQVESMSIERLYEICDATLGERGGVGAYPAVGFVHLDLRGYRARWRG